MSTYYDEDTQTTYYDDQMVLNITEMHEGKRDTNVFIVYDKDDELLYVYGARSENTKYVRYEKTFNDVAVLYKFLSELVANHNVSISANYLSGLTNYEDYDSLQSKVSRYNEVVAYDGTTLTKRLLQKYVTSFLC